MKRRAFLGTLAVTAAFPTISLAAPVDVSFYPGVDPTGTVECSAAINAALLDIASQPYVPPAYFPLGSYLIDPLVGVKVPDIVSLTGDGEDATEFVASNSNAGSIIRRAEYDPVSSINPISQRHRFSDFRVVLKGPQTGLDLRHLSRVLAERVQVTKARIKTELLDSLYIPGSVGIHAGTGNSAGVQPGYAWGDAAVMSQCRIYNAEISVSLTSGHAHQIVRCDIANGYILVNVPDPESSGIVIRGNLLQYCTGRWAVDFGGAGGFISENTFENPLATMCQVLLRAGSSKTVCRVSDNFFYPPNLPPIINDGTGNII